MKALLTIAILLCTHDLVVAQAPPARGESSADTVNARKPESASRASGAASVFVGAVVGGFALTTVFAVSQIGSDQPQPPAGTLPAIWGSGVALGAMLGAAIAQRKVAPLWTTLATAAATAPFIIFAPESDDWNGRIVLVLALPVAAAVIGNTFGQGK